MVYVEILAGGKGTRMGNTDMPKQFMMLGTKPIFIHTIEQFMLNLNVNKILLCCPKEWMSYAKDTLEKYLEDTSDIYIVEGGTTRQETIINGCKFIEKEFGINNDDIVITHDAVRPFVTQRIIDDNIEAARTYGAADTVVPATDTIVEGKDNGFIDNIPDRKKMYQGQTPQSFKLKTLLDILTELSEVERNILTDACKAFVLKGKKVKLVEGEVYNVKVTSLYDLKLCEAIIAVRGKDD